MIEVKCLWVLGPTITCMFSNFMPVTAAFWGFLFLGQMLTPLQLLGGAVVIASGCFFIREKARVDSERAQDESLERDVASTIQESQERQENPENK